MAAVQPGTLKTVFTYRAVTCCLIQALLQLIILLVAIQIIDGQLNISSITHQDETFNWVKTIAFMTYKTYFRDNCMVKIQENGWSCKAPGAFRTYYWILHYIIMCTTWVLTSLLLLVFVPEHKKITCFRQMYRYWWMLVTAIVVISDAFVSIQYLLDLQHTRDELDYYSFIGCNSTSTVCIPDYFQTAYIYVPSIFMAFVFSRGVVGWILTIIMLLSALKHFRRPTPAPKIEKLDENQIDCEESSTRNEDATSSITTLSEAAPTNNPVDQNSYVPWMNVLYLPSIYEESNADKVPEYYDEHHYEHVIGPTDVPGGITIEIPSKHKKETNSIDPADNEENKNDPKLMKIDVGNICIQINQRNSRSSVTAPYYQNMKFMKLPRVSGPCKETDCNVHRAFNFMSVQDENLIRPDT